MGGVILRVGVVRFSRGAVWAEMSRGGLVTLLTFFLYVVVRFFSFSWRGLCVKKKKKKLV